MKSAFSVIAFGVISWVVALVICLAVNASANAIWICLAGVGLGILGLRYTFRRSRSQ